MHLGPAQTRSFFQNILTTVPAVKIVFGWRLSYMQSHMRFLRDPLLDMALDLAIPRPCRREAGDRANEKLAKHPHFGCWLAPPLAAL